MKLINDTPCPGAYIPSADVADTIIGLFLTALTCDITDAGLAASQEQKPLILSAAGSNFSGKDVDPEPEELVADDVQFLRRGVGVTAAGWVYPEKDVAKTALAALAVGDVTRRVMAIGTRVWQEAILGGALTPTGPSKFSRIEMSWDNAYGGIVREPAKVLKVDGEETIVPEHPITSPLNIDGTGFYMTAQQALRQPLPLLEDPDARIKRWDDRPRPVCFAPCPLWSGLRSASMINPDLGNKVDLGRLDKVTGRSCPDLHFEEVPAGPAVKLEGMRPAGEVLAFTVPEAVSSVQVQVGEQRHRVKLLLDAIDIDAEAAQVRFVFRRLYRYALIQGELRSARFVPGPGLSEVVK